MRDRARRTAFDLGERHGVADAAHGLVVRLLAVVPAQERARVRVAAHAAHLVAADAGGGGAVVVAAGAAQDVAARGVAVEVVGALLGGPALGVRVANVDGRAGDALHGMAGVAEGGAVAGAAAGRVG